MRRSASPREEAPARRWSSKPGGRPGWALLGAAPAVAGPFSDANYLSRAATSVAQETFGTLGGLLLIAGKLQALPGSSEMLVQARDLAGDPANGWDFRISAGGVLSVHLGGLTPEGINLGTFAAPCLFSAAVCYGGTGSDVRFATASGVQQQPVTGALSDVSTPLYLGRHGGTAGQAFAHGVLSEVHFLRLQANDAALAALVAGADATGTFDLSSVVYRASRRLSWRAADGVQLDAGSGVLVETGTVLFEPHPASRGGG